MGAIKSLQQTVQWRLNNGTTTLESRVQLMAAAAVNAQLISADGSRSKAVAGEGWVEEAVDLITQFTVHSGQMVSESWRDALPSFFEMYRDGQIFTTNGTMIHRKSMFYPKWWLDLVGYWNVPGNPSGIYFSPGPAEFVQGAFTASNVFAATGVVVLGFAAGRFSSKQTRRRTYMPI